MKITVLIVYPITYLNEQNICNSKIIDACKSVAVSYYQERSQLPIVVNFEFINYADYIDFNENPYSFNNFINALKQLQLSDYVVIYKDKESDDFVDIINTICNKFNIATVLYIPKDNDDECIDACAIEGEIIE